MMRLLIYVASGNGVIDERPFNGIKRLMQEAGGDQKFNLQLLKDTIRQQTFLMRMDEARALRGLNKLLPAKAQRQRALTLARDLLSLSGPISAEKEGRLQRVSQILELEKTAPVKTRTPVKKAVAVKKAVVVKRTRRLG